LRQARRGKDMDLQAYRLLKPARRDGRSLGSAGETVYAIGRSRDGIEVTNLPGSHAGWRAVVPEDELTPLQTIPRQEHAALDDARRYLDIHDTDGVETERLLAHYASIKTAQIGDVLSDPAAVHVNMMRGAIALPSIRSALHAHSAEALEAWDAALRVAEAYARIAPIILPPRGGAAPGPEDADAAVRSLLGEVAALAGALSGLLKDSGSES